MLRQVATCDYLDSHDKNELKEESSTSNLKRYILAHVIELGERVDSTGLTIVPPLVGPVDNILQQRGND